MPSNSPNRVLTPFSVPRGTRLRQVKIHSSSYPFPTCAIESRVPPPPPIANEPQLKPISNFASPSIAAGLCALFPIGKARSPPLRRPTLTLILDGRRLV